MSDLNEPSICPFCNEVAVTIVPWVFMNGFTNTEHEGLTEECASCEGRFWSSLTYNHNFYIVHGPSDGQYRRVHKPKSIFQK